MRHRFYMSCYQVNIGGSGSTTPATVKFPGAYSAQDPVRELVYPALTAVLNEGNLGYPDQHLRALVYLRQ